MITYNTKIKLHICDIQLILEKLIDRVYKTWLIDTHFWRSNYAKWRLYLQISFSHNQLLQKFRKTVFIFFFNRFLFRVFFVTSISFYLHSFRNERIYLVLILCMINLMYCFERSILFLACVSLSNKILTLYSSVAFNNFP